MLLIFRLFFFAIGLAVLAVTLLARGLVPEPAFHTRIGEVPSLSRPLMQQAIIVPTEWERRFVVSTGSQAGVFDGAPEPTELAETIPPVPAATGTPVAAGTLADTGADETSRAAYVSPVIWSRNLRSDPLAQLIRALRAETPALTPALTPASRQIAARGPAAVEPPALAFGIDEPTSEDDADAGSAAEASKPTATKRQEKAETGAEATAKTKAQTKARTGAKAAVSPPAKASKAKNRRKSVRRGKTTRASKRKVAARPSVRSRRSKTKRARSSQRGKRRIVRRKASAPVATRTTYTYVRQHPNSIYRYEPPRYYRYYFVPQHRTNRTNTR